jgi:signal transduction protein with GAF and PtsI domain
MMQNEAAGAAMAEKENGSGMDWSERLGLIIEEFGADSGTIHLLGKDGTLKLAASQGIPEVVLERVQSIPIGKGMAGLAAARREPVTICNLQTDTSGDARPGARLTGMEGAIAVPMLDGAGAVKGVLGIANRAARTFSEDEQQRLLKLGRALVGE